MKVIEHTLKHKISQRIKICVIFLEGQFLGKSSWPRNTLKEMILMGKKTGVCNQTNLNINIICYKTMSSK